LRALMLPPPRSATPLALPLLSSRIRSTWLLSSSRPPRFSRPLHDVQQHAQKSSHLFQRLAECTNARCTAADMLSSRMRSTWLLQAPATAHQALARAQHVE
jgi:hypothetical protein